MTEQQLEKKCPLLNLCRNVTGINCISRDYMQCRFYLKLLEEKEKKFSPRKNLNKKFPKVFQRV